MKSKLKKDSEIIYEAEDDVLNIWLSRKPIDYAEQNGDVIVHFTKNDEAVYVEILDASKFLKDLSKTLPKSLKREIWADNPTPSVAHRIK
mgnify:CR=1 FL=1